MINFLKNNALYLEQLKTVYGSDHAHFVFGWLCEKVTGTQLANLNGFTSKQEKQLGQWIHKLVHEHYPLQYLLGEVYFGDVIITVEAPVLIPRPETQEWVYNAIESLSAYKNEPLRILDLCTGSGCIGVALAHYFKNAHIDVVDLYEKPLELTKKNVLSNNCANISVIQSDLFQNLQGKTYDLIFSNPPYIDEAVWQTLSPTVKEWEDKHALVADEKGLALYKRIILELPIFLRSDSLIQNNPKVYLEIGYDQGQKVKALLEHAGFKLVKIYKDFAEHDRMASAY